MTILLPGSTAPDVVRLQRALIGLGYALPRYGVDGVLGDETLYALGLALSAHRRQIAEAPCEVTAEDLALVLDLAARRSPQPAVEDVRSVASRKVVTGRRSWGEITGMCLHQTACILGERPARWASIGAHVGVTRGGKIIWMHDFDEIVIHANRFNASTVGIEMDGMYAGVEGDDRTFWRPPSDPNRRPQVPTPELIESAKSVVRWIVDEVARHGGRVTHLVAHRQASKDRQSDPGSALWQAVALPLLAELGLTDGGPGYRVGSGLAIPEAWDPARKGVAY